MQQRHYDYNMAHFDAICGPAFSWSVQIALHSLSPRTLGAIHNVFCHLPLGHLSHF